MSKTVDSRVVEMRFDNKQFESNAATTMSTLQKLKKSLDFSKVGDSFDEINKASKKVDMNGLCNAVSGVRDKFSALEVVAITTLSNITNSFVNSAKRWISEFTIEPIKSGFQEYETQMNAVQTILANTQKEGTNIKDVNAALDELNLYADKTIYNFTEMTRNIGTFTAAGVDLKTSVSAIQGIANLAAVSGSNSQQASTAMYQLSQALAAGTIKLQDWNSVVNAGMGGEMFQDALKETSRLLGTNVDAAIEATGSFRESLKKGWLTSEVLTETLKKFTTSGAAEYVANYTGLTKEAVESEVELAKSMYGEADAIDKAAESLASKSGKNKDEIAQTLRFAQTAEDAATKVKTFTQLIDTLKEAVQSGWSMSFRIIIGDFEEAKELFTEISDSFGAVISASADARNKLLAEVFNKKDAQDYLAAIVDAPKEAIDQLQIVAKEAGTTSELFKNTLDVFTEGDDTMNQVVTHLIDMLNSEKDVVTYISDITGMTEESIEELKKVGSEVGYTSDEFNDMADVLSEGDPVMKETITNLLKMSEASQKPSGRELLIDSLRNSLKGLISVISPVQKAFREVFPPATADQVYGMLEAFHKFSEQLTISEKNSENLRKAFKGVFDVGKLLGDGFASLLKVLIPIERPLSVLGTGFLDLSGYIGQSLSMFSDAVRSSSKLSGAFDLLSRGVSSSMDALTRFIKVGIEFIKRLSKMEGTVKLIDSIGNAFERLYIKGSPYVKNFVEEAIAMLDSFIDIDNVDLDEVLNQISKAFSDLALEIDNFSFKTIEEGLNTLRNKIKEISNLAMSNEGLAAFVNNFKEYGEELKDAFSIENLLDRLDKMMSVFDKFFNWVKDVMAPAFEDFNAGSVVATGGGLGLIYAMIKASNAFDKVADSISSIPDLLGAVKDGLEAYQNKLKADTIIKIAGAIGILAGALVLLSFADTDRLLKASGAFTIVAGTLLFGMSKLLEVGNKGQELNASLLVLSNGLSSTMKKFGRALEIKAVGSAVKKFAESIVIIAVSIIALGVMYNKDKEALMAGTKLVGMIGLALTGIMAGMSIFGNLMKGKGMSNFSKAALGVLSLSASLSLCVAALTKLFKMEFPPDWQFKITVLAGMLAGLGALALALGVASRIAGKNKMSSGIILSTAALLMTTVLALDKLFKMEFPPDWQEKVVLLGLMFTGFGALMVTMGVASRLAGGSIKAAGTILTMCIFIGTIVTALSILSVFPADKLIKGATAFGITLTTLGMALFGASKVSSNETAKSVLSMAIMVGAITASLGVLSMIPGSKLLKGAVALGGILLVLSESFKQVSKITEKGAWANILLMVAAMSEISYSLYVLAEQPWEGLLAGATAMSAVLLSLAQTFKKISESRGVDLQSIGLFLLATTSLLPIGVALYELAKQPWENMLAAGVALSATISSFSVAFAIISATNPNLSAIGTFLAASVSVGLIAFALYELAKQPWENLLAASQSLSSVLLAMSTAMAICSVIGAAAGPAITGIGLLDLFIANFALVLTALGALFQSEGAKALISGGSQILIQIGEAIGGFVGSIVGGLLLGISSSLPQIGTDLSNFMINLKPFIDGSKNIDAGALASVGFLSGIILSLTAAEVINGIASLFGLSLVDVAVELSEFMTALQPFVLQSRDLKEDVMRACGYLATMIITLTGAEIIAGISKFLGIGGSISEFGKELSEFGPYIKQFSEEVKEINPESVQGAASAAEIMANMAKKLPGTDGLAQKIFGEKSLAEFGQELVKFGPAIKQFGETVKDVKPDAVTGAASAAEIMANLATKLPAQDGLAQKIFGEKSLSEFGKELVKFGPNIVQFADQVKNVKPDAVTGAAFATRIMSNLANELPSSDTLWNKIFGGGKVTLSEFGQELIKFGTAMSNFSSSVSGINTSQISGAITSFKELVDLASYVQGISASNFIDFINNLEKIGLDAVNKFSNVFTNSSSKVRGSFEKFSSDVKNSISSVFKGIDSLMETNGRNIVEGLIRGMESKTGSLKTSAANLGEIVDKTFTKYMKIKSPSRVMRLRGEQVDEGLANGIEENSDEPEKAIEEVAARISGIVKEKLISKAAVESASNNLNNLIKVMTSAEEQLSQLEKESEAISKLSQSEQKRINDERLRNESEFWQKLYATKAAGIQNDKGQQTDFITFQKNTLQETVEVLQAYVDKLESTRDSLMGGDLFSEVSQQTSRSKDEIRKNLKDQIKELDKYTYVLNELNVRLEGTNLADYIQTLGVDSLAQLQVLNSMTDTELTEYANLYDQKMEAATRAAAAQLSTLQQETEQKLASIFGTMSNSVNLADFASVFDGSIQSINDYVARFIQPLEQAAQSANEAGAKITQSMFDGIKGGFESGNMSGVISSAIGTTLTTVSQEQTTNAQTTGSEIGGYLSSGIGEGMLSDTSAVTAAGETLTNIVNALKSAGEINSPSELTRREVGTYITQGIGEGMKDGIPELSTASTEIIKAISDSLMSEAKTIPEALKSALPSESFSTVGQSMIQSMIDGINVKDPLMRTTISNLCTAIINKFKTELTDSIFKTFGENIVLWISQGVSSKKSYIESTVVQLCSSIIAAFRNNLTESTFREIGANAALGLKYGIESKIDEIASAAIRAARRAVDAAREELDEHSPSKVMEKVGEFFSIGMADGIVNRLRAISLAGGMAADEAIEPVKKVVDDISSIIDSEDFNPDPVIRPVIDLTNVQNGVQEISSLMNRTYDISISRNKAMDAMSSFSNITNDNVSKANETSSKSGEGDKFEFNQYNYSPKALSRSEIYRQTNNQFSAFRKAVNPS